MTAGLSLWPATACLITELADELLLLDDESLRQTTVVLPTKRLHTWLLALLAKSRGALVPPRLLTFDEFVEAWAPAAADDSLTPLSPLAEELLLAALLKEQSYRHLRLGFEHEIRQFFAELVEWSLVGQAFTALARVIETNVYLSDGGMDTLRDRTLELEDLHGRWTEAAREIGAESATARLARRSLGLATKLSERATGEVSPPLYVVGFSSLAGMHWPLLEALAKGPSTHVWLSQPPALASEQNPLALMVAAAKVAPTLRQATLHQYGARLEIHRAASVLEEVAHALTLCREAFDCGLPPSAVALLVTNDAAYGKPLRALLKGFDLNANVALATPLADTAVGSWLEAFLALLQSGEGATEVLALAAHPLTLAWWNAQINAEGGVPLRDSWRERLSLELCGIEVERGLGWMAGSRGLSPAVAAYLASLKNVLEPFLAAPAKTAKSLSVWGQDFGALCRAVVLPHAAEVLPEDDPGILLSTVRGLESFLTDLAAIASRHSGDLRPAEFYSLLSDQVLKLDVRSVGDPLAGLQVLSVSEARYVPFARVIVLGSVEGDFPRALPKDHLIDNYLRSRIGLPGWRLLEAIEDTTFHLLSARLPELLLLYPTTRGGEKSVRSRFIESALVEQENLEEQAVQALPALLALLAVQGSKTERMGFGPTARLGRHGAYAGDREELVRTMSASALEDLVRCPYRFLLGRLGVREVDLPGQDEVKQEGDWLHDVLEAFFTGEVSGRVVDGPVDVTVGWEAFPLYAQLRLERLTGVLAPPGFEGSPLDLHLKFHSWPAFVAHLTRIYRPETLALMRLGFREFALDHKHEPATVAIGARAIPLRGSIDSVDQLGGLHLITDYKRSGSPDKASVKAGLSPQLLVYAQALEAKHGLPLRLAVVGYWSILKGTWQGVLAGSDALDQAKSLGLVGSRDKDLLEAATDGLNERWLKRQEAYDASGEFEPDSNQCGFCRFSGICRKDDPEIAPLLAARRAPEVSA